MAADELRTCFHRTGIVVCTGRRSRKHDVDNPPVIVAAALYFSNKASAYAVNGPGTSKVDRFLAKETNGAIVKAE